MKQTFKLTKEEFIKRSMAGDVFEFRDEKYFYDLSQDIPFRFGGYPLKTYWENFDGINEFVLVEPEPETESWAQFRVWDNIHLAWDTVYLCKDVEHCKKVYSGSMYSLHHEIPNTRVDLPKVV